MSQTRDNPIIAAMLERAERAYQLHMDDVSHFDGAYPDIAHDYYCDVEALVGLIEDLERQDAEVRKAAQP